MKKTKIISSLIILILFLSCTYQKNHNEGSKYELGKSKVLITHQKLKNMNTGNYQYFDLFKFEFTNPVSKSYEENYYTITVSNDSLTYFNGLLDTMKFSDSIFVYKNKTYLTTSGFSAESKKDYKTIFVVKDLCLMRYWVLNDGGRFFFAAIDSIPSQLYYTRRYVYRSSATICHTLFDCFDKIEANEYSISYETLDSFSISLIKNNYSVQLTQIASDQRNPMYVAPNMTKCPKCDFYFFIRKDEINNPHFPTLPL